MGTKDLVLAEDGKEKSDGDAQQGQRNRIMILSPLKCRRVVAVVVHRNFSNCEAALKLEHVRGDKVTSRE
jgi:hypothetical protein